MNRLLELARRVSFAGASVLAALAVAEGLVQLVGSTLTGGHYGAGRLLEFAGILMLFAIGLLLWDIHSVLRRDRS